MWVDLRSLWESSGSPDVTVALTGVSGTGAVGSVAVAFTLAFSGVAGTGSVGSVAPAITASLSGNAGTGSVGSVASSSGLALVGVGGAGSVGTVAPLSGLPLAGSTATGSVGTVALSFDIALTGNAGTGAVGFITVAGDVTTLLTGVEATSAVGSLTASTVTPALTDPGGYFHRGFDLKAWKKKQKPLKELEDDIERLYKEITSPPLVKQAEKIVKPFVPVKLRDEIKPSNVEWDRVVESIRTIEKLHALYEQEINDDDDDIEDFLSLL